LRRPLASLLVLVAVALACAGCGARRARDFRPPEDVARPVRPAGVDEMHPVFGADMRQIEHLMAADPPPFERLLEPAHRLHQAASKLVWLAEVGCETPEDRFLRDARMVRTNAAGLWDAAMTRRLERARTSWRKFKISFGYCYPIAEEASAP